MKRSYFLTFGCVAIVALAACAKQAPRAARASGGARSARAILVERQILERIWDTRSIRALAWLEISDGDEERRTDAAIAIARPDRVRVDAMDQLADVWAEAGSDGARLWLFIPARAKLYAGRASRANLRRLAKFDWEIPDLVAVLAGTPPTGDSPELVEVGEADGEREFAGLGGALRIWTSGKGQLPTRCVRMGAGGQPDYEVTFADYRRVEGTLLPYRIEARFPARGARIAVTYRDIALGGMVDDAAFRPPEARAGKQVELKE